MERSDLLSYEKQWIDSDWLRVMKSFFPFPSLTNAYWSSWIKKKLGQFSVESADFRFLEIIQLFERSG